jgi:hypothetical protein
MNRYTIEMKYIKNKEMFIFSILACILEEISKLEYDREQAIQALAKVSESYSFVLKFQNTPNEVLNSYDELELTSFSRRIINLQENINNLVELLNTSIIIDIIGQMPLYKDEILADFGEFIIFNNYNN